MLQAKSRNAINQLSLYDIEKEFSIINEEKPMTFHNKGKSSLVFQHNHSTSEHLLLKVTSISIASACHNHFLTKSYIPIEDISALLNTTKIVKRIDKENIDIPIIIQAQSCQQVHIIDDETILLKEYESIQQDFTIHKMLLNCDYDGIAKTLKIFDKPFTKIDYLKDLLKQKDNRGNTPIMLCVILHNFKKQDTYLQILKLLLENSADFKSKDISECTPLEYAISHTDKESVELLYEAYLLRRQTKLNQSIEKVTQYFKTLKNFYVEMTWEVHIPLFTFACPNDTCKIWKVNDSIRMDYTFQDYKGLSSIRNPTAFLLLGTNCHIVNLKDKTFFDKYESLDPIEKSLIIKDLLDMKRVNGSFKIIQCELHESLSGWYSNKKVIETINGWTAQKYQLDLKVKVDIHDNEQIEYTTLTHETYFNDLSSIIKSKKTKNNLDKIIGKTDNNPFKKELIETKKLKEKELKAYIWIVDKSPIKTEEMINLLRSLSSANELAQKLIQFIEHPDIAEIIKNNGFPIKVTIPFNIFISFTVVFNNYKDLTVQESESSLELFDIIKECQKIPRMEGEQLVKSQKKRMKYVNIR